MKMNSHRIQNVHTFTIKHDLLHYRKQEGLEKDVGLI